MLTLSITFIGGTYEASKGAEPEWPPHPGRVFSALVAQAEPGSTDDDALRWLEEQPPPIVLGGDTAGSILEAFVPTNRVSAKNDTHQTYLGRTAGSRTWMRSNPCRDEVHLVWETSKAPPEVRERLSYLSRRVPYLGRSTSPVVISVSTEKPDDDGLRRWEHPGDGSTRLRAAHPGSLSDLRETYDAGEPARSVDHWIAYGAPALIVEQEPTTVDGAWTELLTFGFPKGRSIDGRLVVRVAIAWRSAVLEALGTEFPAEDLAQLHGHRDGSGHQCAFLALPFVGAEHGDGQIRGLGLALTDDLPRPVRLALLRHLGMDADRPRIPDFYVPGLVSGLRLEHGTFDGRATVDSRRWRTGRGAHAWETALPIVLDRYPHRREDPADHVRAACTFAGFPDPAEVDVLRASTVPGAMWLRRSDLRRRDEDAARPAVHARVVFDMPVRGPVVLGHLRHLGLGLCLPTREEMHS